MKTILLPIHFGSEVRQFGHSGFIEALAKAGYTAVIGTDFDDEDLARQWPGTARIVRLPPPPKSFWYEQLASALDLGQANWRRRNGKSTWAYGRRAPRKVRQRLRLAVISGVGAFLADRRWFGWGRALESRLARAKGVTHYGAFLDSVKPDAIIVNAPRINYQPFLLEAAAQRGICRFLFFHTNKDVVALSRLDHTFSAIGVWNHWMSEQLLDQNPGQDPDSVFITGCSHFDSVGRTAELVDDVEFRRALGVPKDALLVLYTAAGPGAVPAEERFVEAVCLALRELPDTRTRLIVRLNPMDPSDRIADYLRSRWPEVVVLRPDWHYSPERNLCFQRRDDSILFNALLHHSAVCVNIPSTVTVECALVGVPVLNLAFDLPGPVPGPGSIQAFWDVDYYANVRQTGAALRVASVKELVPALAACLADHDLLDTQQRHLVQLELGGVRPPNAHQEYLKVLTARIGAR